MPFLPQRYNQNLPDIGHEETDNLLDDLTAEIESVFGQAYDELLQKANAYLSKFKIEDNKKRQEFLNGDITKTIISNGESEKFLQVNGGFLWLQQCQMIWQILQELLTV